MMMGFPSIDEKKEHKRKKWMVYAESVIIIKYLKSWFWKQMQKLVHKNVVSGLFIQI